jgi:DDE superfamily endonuclease/Winged helix-turn helix
VAPYLQHPGARSPDLPPHRRAYPLFAPDQARQLVETVTTTEPVVHGLSGHGWTLKKLRQWVLSTFGRAVGRNAIRRMLLAARLSWKKIKKVLGKAKPRKRVEPITRLEELFARVCRDEVTLVSIDESHFHQDLDEGYTWGPKGKRSWRVSTTPGLSERLNWYGAYDFSHGQCLIWEDGPCDGNATCHFLERVARWRAGLPGKIVVIWDNAPCHIARVVTGHAEELGLELVFLPGYSPDLNPIERLWDWMREEVTRGHCHCSLKALRAACQQFIAAINGDPEAVVDRLWPKFELDPEHEAKLLVST